MPTPASRKSWIGSIAWSGKGVFASKDRRIAVINTAKKVQHFSQDADVLPRVTEKEPITLHLYGGKSAEDALDKLYGTMHHSTGYIYFLERTGFRREDGLGGMELVTRTVPTLCPSKQFPKGIETINARAEIQKYIDQGLIKVRWHSVDKEN